MVFSDMQTHDQLPQLSGVSVFVFNTGGYRTTPLAVGRQGHYELGGFTDATFRLVPMLENLPARRLAVLRGSTPSLLRLMRPLWTFRVLSLSVVALYNG